MGPYFVMCFRLVVYCALGVYGINGIENAPVWICAKVSIVPSQALIPHCARQTLVARSCLCIRHRFHWNFLKPVLTPYDIKNKRWNKIKKCIRCLRVYGHVHFQNVDRKGFKEMVKTLNPRLALSARTHFSQIDMPNLQQGLWASGERNQYY